MGAVVAATAVLATGPLPSTGGAVTRAAIPSASRSDPSRAKVVRGRFVSTVRLDGGVVTIRPAPSGLHPTVGEWTIQAQVWATSQIMGYRPLALGFGLVTITRRTDGVPRVVNLPAWIGLASDSQVAFHCPAMMPSPARPGPPLPTPGDAAVVVGSRRGGPAVVYRARSAPCGSVTPASLTNALESVSVPWSAGGALVYEALQVRVEVPDCGGIGGIASGGSAAAMTITAYALVPESPAATTCPPPRTVTQTVVLGPGNAPGAPPPLVTSRTQILHGALGPVRVVGAGP